MDKIKCQNLGNDKFLVTNEENGTSSEIFVAGDKFRNYSFLATKDSGVLTVNSWRFPMCRVPLVMGEPTWYASFYFDGIFDEKQIGLQLIIKLPLEENDSIGSVSKEELVEYYIETINKVSELERNTAIDIIVNNNCWVKKSSL